MSSCSRSPVSSASQEFLPYCAASLDDLMLCIEIVSGKRYFVLRNDIVAATTLSSEQLIWSARAGVAEDIDRSPVNNMMLAMCISITYFSIMLTAN